MKILVRHLLLLGAMLGLLWQGVAYASPPCAEMQQEQISAMADMADCMDSEQGSTKKAMPCDDMSPGCMAMAGCAALSALEIPASAVAQPAPIAMAKSWQTTPVLVGRNEAPDPDPPSILG
jgi:hypothetical protein